MYTYGFFVFKNAGYLCLNGSTLYIKTTGLCASWDLGILVVLLCWMKVIHSNLMLALEHTSIKDSATVPPEKVTSDM